jgi:hypothetical protein
MQGDKNRILPKDINATGSSETLIGWKSGQTTYVPLWDQKEGAWRWTQFSVCVKLKKGTPEIQSTYT